MSKKNNENEMEKLFEDVGFELIESVRKSVAKNQSNIEKLARHMKLDSSSLVVDIILPQVIAVMFMAGLMDDISPEDFISYAESFTDRIKNDILKIRIVRANNSEPIDHLNKES